jgi:hypothetical protein
MVINNPSLLYLVVYSLFTLLLFVSFIVYLTYDIRRKNVHIILHQCKMNKLHKSCKLSQNPDYYPCELLRYHNANINTIDTNRKKISNILFE